MKRLRFIDSPILAVRKQTEAVWDLCREQGVSTATL
jgi:hypothetical protein